ARRLLRDTLHLAARVVEDVLGLAQRVALAALVLGQRLLGLLAQRLGFGQRLADALGALVERREHRLQALPQDRRDQDEEGERQPGFRCRENLRHQALPVPAAVTACSTSSRGTSWPSSLALTCAAASTA